MNNWQPIETAPKDGTNLLLGWWRTWPKVEWETTVGAAGNIDVAKRGRGYLHGYATHWMPLPAPPTDIDDIDEVETHSGKMPYKGAR